MEHDWHTTYIQMHTHVHGTHCTVPTSDVSDVMVVMSIRNGPDSKWRVLSNVLVHTGKSGDEKKQFKPIDKLVSKW